MNLQQRIASSFGLTIVILLIAVSPQVASAQSSFPTCVLASYQWSFNSQNQSPCEVAAQLLGVCTGGSYTLPSLPMENHYLGPTIDTRNPCQCSTVAYSMVSACAACQNSTITAWSEWTTNCATVSLDVFPEPIPQGTFVPGWAFLDVKASDGFDPIPAKDHANATESTALPMPSSTARATRSLTSSIAGPSSGSTPTEAAGSSAFDEARSNANQR
ncbi:hypothetical protein C8J56DRAFT_256550 [Mycena floridula]|nr:hypothetical protein C8J56DRAFT_256550 [Mycena floridula]